MVTLSIITPNYNYGHYLQSALDSILKTNRTTDFEIVVIDDGSTDHSRDILKTYENNPRMRPVYLKENVGVAQAINLGISVARGKFLHFFASDDLHLAGSIDLIMNYIKAYPHLPLFCSDWGYFSDPQKIKSTPLLPCNAFQHFNAHQVHTLFKHTDFWIPGHTLFVKKEIHAAMGPLDQKLGSICDWVINHTIALTHGIGYLPQNLVAMRTHANALSSSQSPQARKEIWHHLLTLLQTNPSYRPLAKSGLLRMLGLKTIYKTLLFNPRHWKFTLPIARKECEKLLFKWLRPDRSHFWMSNLIAKNAKSVENAKGKKVKI